jgi:hypothetical protein
MELAMGTPNSTIPEQALEEYLLGGVTPELRVLCALGMDVKLLKNRYEAIKPQLPYLEGYTMLESACEHVRDRTKTWKDLVNEAKLTGTKVIRFAFLVNTFNAPILSLYPVGNGGYGRDIEVFLVRNGDWLIWDGGDFPETPPRFIRHRTAELAVDRLREIGGNQHEFFSSHYQELRYWPFPGLQPNRVGRQEQSVALVLAKHLSWLLQASIAAKQSRLLTQTTLLDTFNKVDQRSGLNI